MLRIVWLKTASMALLIMGTLMAGSWWSTTRLFADGPAIQPAATAPLIAPIDVETDETKYEDCRQVLASIIDAHGRQDKAAYASLLYFSPSADPRYVKIAPLMMDVDLAQFQMQKSAFARFGAHAAGLLFYWTTTVVTFEDLLSRMQPKDATEDGDTVIFNPPAPLFQRGGIWPHAPLYFQKVDGTWKLDVGRSTKIKIHFRRRIPVPGETEEELLLSTEKGLIDSIKAITRDIDQGKIESAGRLQQRLDGAVIGIAMQLADFNVDVTPQ